MGHILASLKENLTLLTGVLLAISELLAAIPPTYVNANSVWQLVWNLIKGKRP